MMTSHVKRETMRLIRVKTTLTSPKYFCTNSEPTTRMKEADVELATALTSIVLPVPMKVSLTVARN